MDNIHWIWRYCLIIFNFSYLPVVFEFCIILHLYLISANCQYRCMSILHYENLTCSQSREGKSRSADCQLKMVRHKSRGRVVREGLQCQALPKSWHCQKGGGLTSAGVLLKIWLKQGKEKNTAKLYGDALV